jgi:alanyl-tRNA synthetase
MYGVPLCISMYHTHGADVTRGPTLSSMILSTAWKHKRKRKLCMQAERVGGAQVIVEELDGADAASMQKAVASLSEQLGDPSAVVLGSRSEDKVALVAAFSPSLVKDKKMSAGKFVGGLAKICGGGGGGKPALAQAGGQLPEKLPEALTAAKQQLVDALS